ncbi:MAG: alpha-glucosidase [Alphaproteobacteria bacterium]|nr:alpha-glucosidase [Alphaproteobacteria bacterium]MCB9974729.1 alpha-glucosidase [Rhodospirillales bacterium]
MSTPADWWKHAVIYQIYPRSYQDSNNDGIGDIPGITSRLEYIAGLGVDGIWISPFFPSPMKDFGYDVSDYRNVDPLFGSLEDFRTLLDKAHSLDLRIIIDLVLSHTSDQHPWFQQSRMSKDNVKSDWYVWADKKTGKNGGLAPPNNWVSVFGGSAWTFDESRGQYYLHNFLREQPDLNYHNPEVQNEALDIARFWLDLGVDGFRLDTVNFYFHDRLLRDNPPRTEGVQFATQLEVEVPYSQQQHIYDKSQPENLTFLERLRTLMDQYPGTFTVGEIGDDHPYRLARIYTSGKKRLHCTYNTHMMSGTLKDLTEDMIREPVEKFMDYKSKESSEPGWPGWAFSNHDVVRASSRWYKPFDHNPAFSKMLIALLLCLPGTLFLYQGEELGLPEAEIPFDKLQDPWAKETWPHWQGRDGCRTPIPWSVKSPFCGFSRHEPWLPLPSAHGALAVSEQENKEGSVLTFTKNMIEWRKKAPALATPDCDFIRTSSTKLLHIIRGNPASGEMECVFNLSGETVGYKNKTLKEYGFSLQGWPES